ncbi:MAG: hypothetical protein DMF62_03770 [Acidobacteria bacterium]|nr:MAG: hypothetical protein DMF62_03770 [Acidobacteriota bacterium]
MSDSPGASPLDEANPVISMQEIMSRDPEELTRADRDAIVRTLRAQRFQFMQEEQQEKPKRKNGKKTTGPISLADLGL